MVGICIKYFHENYGGMLQAYATVQIFENRNIDYELIRYKKTRDFRTLLRNSPRILNTILLNDKLESLKKRMGIKFHPDFSYNNTIRMRAFDEFRKKHFTKLSAEYVGYKELCKGAEKYDAVISGSDQLWSPAGLPTNFYNLRFVPSNIRKISYASSFGVKKIPWYQLSRTKKFLDRIEFISMRENRGSEIVKEITGRSVLTVLDPVFMFDQNEWEKLIPVKLEYNQPYIFAYFLGNNSEHRDAVKKLAHLTGMRIVTLRHLDQYVREDEKFGDYSPYDVDPDRFLNLLRGAEYVCTDSFHGSCFSIIHKKKFMVFNRYANQSQFSKNSRIDTLCDNLDLSDRRFNGEIEKIIQPINFDDVCKKLKSYIEVANSYIDEALDGIV